jgi:hypothetical protein
MWSLATNDSAETNNRIKLTRFCESKSEQWNLKCAGHSVNSNPIFVSTEPFQSIKSALQQPTRDELVPPTGDYSKAEAFSIEVSFVNRRLQNRFNSANENR